MVLSSAKNILLDLIFIDMVLILPGFSHIISEKQSEIKNGKETAVTLERYDFTESLDNDTPIRNRQHLCEAIVHAIRSRSGLCCGRYLISERKAAANLGMGRDTVHLAYEQLLRDGILIRDPGKKRYRISDFSRGGYAGNIGILLPVSFSEYISPHPVSTLRFDIYRGIVDRATMSGLGTIILMPPSSLENDAKINDFMHRIMPSLIGVIHLGMRKGENPDEVLDWFCKNGSIPQVCFFRISDSPRCGTVEVDERETYRTIGNYFLSQGLRDLGIFFPEYPASPRIYHTFSDIPFAVKCFRETGMRVREESVFALRRKAGGSVTESLEEAVEKLSAMKHPPSALWCRNDAIALQLIKLLKQRGFRIPEDFSVIGMDNIPDAAHSEPPLTTLQLPAYNCGRNAVELLLGIREKGGSARTVKLNSSLIVRASVAPQTISEHEMI